MNNYILLNYLVGIKINRLYLWISRCVLIYVYYKEMI